MRTIGTFEVGLKAFLVRGERLLLVRERIGEQLWELPGGRFDVGEEALPPHEILRRELAEELGDALRWELVGLRDAWVRPAPERSAHVFLLGHECRWLAGEVRLSDEHVEARWVGPEESRRLPLAEPYPEVLARFWGRRVASG
jgi:8-oxo-dGTP pyrophosphatase MutT (NUDIX family)